MKWASYIFNNIDFWSMQKWRFLIFISKTICRIKKFQIRKRCTSTRRAITYFLFRIFMHFDFLLIIGKVLFPFKRRVPLFDPDIELCSEIIKFYFLLSNSESNKIWLNYNKCPTFCFAIRYSWLVISKNGWFQ